MPEEIVTTLELLKKIKELETCLFQSQEAAKALSLDAARYQWLRKMHDVCGDEITLWHVRGDDGQPINFGRLDAAIDNAMKETK